jgi:predicted MFS family arabinose efflux permease
MNIQQGRSLASGIYYSGYYCGGFIGAWCCAIAYQYGQWTATVLILVLVQILALLVACWGLKH